MFSDDRHSQQRPSSVAPAAPSVCPVRALVELQKIRDDVPVILSSGYNEPVQQSGSRGPSGFLKKPYKLAALKQLLRDVLGD